MVDVTFSMLVYDLPSGVIDRRRSVARDCVAFRRQLWRLNRLLSLRHSQCTGSDDEPARLSAAAAGRVPARAACAEEEATVEALVVLGSARGGPGHHWCREWWAGGPEQWSLVGVHTYPGPGVGIAIGRSILIAGA